MTVQLQKIIRDLWIYRLRTGLSILAITVGLTLFGANWYGSRYAKDII